MRLVDVCVQHWRGLDQESLTALDPGLNLILGENETGKSRIAEAIWFGLFESSKGRSAHKVALQSWNGVGDPTVVVGLEHGGSDYRVAKTFGKGPCTTILEAPGATWKGEEAEARLADLLGVAHQSGGRPAKEVDLGIWPLLWVRQFASAEEPQRDLNEDTRARIQDVLAEVVGEVSSGPLGHRVLERARAERSVYYTEKGQERAPLRDAAAAVERAREELTAAARARQELEKTDAELGRLRESLRRQGQQAAKARAALEQARALAAQAGTVRASLELQRGEARLLEAQVNALRRDVALREQREQAGIRVQGEIERLQDEELARLLLRREELEARTCAAESELEKALTERKEARQSARRVASQQQRVELDRRIGEGARQLQQAVGLRDRLAEYSRQDAAVRVEPSSLDRLRKVYRQWETLQARLRGASTRIRVTARSELHIAGETLARGEQREWFSSEPFALVIDRVAELEIVPGGEELTELRHDSGRLREEWETQLAELEARSLEEAESLLAEKERARQSVRDLEPLLQDLCPDGIAALEGELAQLRSRRQALGDDDSGVPEEDAVQARIAAAEQVETECRAQLETLRRSLAAVENDLTGARTALAGQERAAAEIRAALENSVDPDALRKELTEAERKWQEALATVQGLTDQYEQLGGNRAERDVQRLQAARDGLQAELEQMNRRRADLEATLRVLSNQDIHEREQEAALRLEEAELHAKRIRRRAAAARTLAETLEVCRAESQRRLLAPAVDAVRRYLRMLFPQVDVDLDDELNLLGLRTDNHREPLPALSGGTREQLGTIVRLGLAELLAGDERLPLVFDDAFTNTDFRRIEQMHQILFAAARHLQILVFSCHPEAFAGLGAGRRYRLEAGRR